MKARPNPHLIAAMQKALAQTTKAEVKPAEQTRSLVPITAHDPRTEEALEIAYGKSEHPLLDRWTIRGIKLSPSKVSYFALLKGSYFCVVRQTGEPLAMTRHLLDLYQVPVGATLVSEIMEEKPIGQALTQAFIFHDLSGACRAIMATLPEFVS
jgi:hypothetical protein